MSELLEYKCPCCGGAIGFDSSAQKMKCPYCDTEFDVETLKSFDEELKNEKEDDMKWDSDAGSEWQEGEADDLVSYICKSCGGEIVADANTAATICPFCGNNVIMTGKLSGELRPDLVLPFVLDKKAAKEGLMKHFKGKRLLPKTFKDENHIDEVKGLYVPVWLFDADADAHIRYKATRVRSWSDSKYRYTETSFFSVVRGGGIGFENVPVDGSEKMPDEIMESLEPYDYSKAVDFQTAYLAGYFADKYDVSSDQSKDRANERIKHSTEDAFRSTVNGYASVTCESSSISLSGGKIKYALCPVWILNTTWKDKNYIFAMNGQTGKFTGDLPLDRAAYWKWWLIYAALICVGSTLLMVLVNLL